MDTEDAKAGGEPVGAVADALVGVWAKAAGAACAAPYPDELDLRPGGRYVGRNREGARAHPLWDAGSYEILGHRRIAISTSYDARPTYEFSLAGDVLVFVDGNGCRFAYHRRGHEHA